MKATEDLIMTPVAAQPVIALLVDDQPILGRAMKDMLRFDGDIQFHFCQEPLKAVALAEKLAPTVILQDLNMPELDGLALLKRFRANSETREIPIIVLSSKEDPMIKAQAFALGASDYLVKLPDRVELIARIRHHSRGYVAQLERNEAYRRLAHSERQLAEEIAQAAKYVQSLLPAPIKDGPVRIKWFFVPSTQLGGDAFGYQWLDEGHFAVYLLDVSGHGVGSSLLAVSILNIMSHRTLPHTDFHDPAAVMRGLNDVFSMDTHGKHFFTIWYGVYSVANRMLKFSGGGHPPALLFGGTSSSDARFQELHTSGPPIGVAHELSFNNATIQIPTFSRLILYSDGVVEIRKPNGEVSDQEAFTRFAVGARPYDDFLERALDRCRGIRDSVVQNDDCSLIQIDFS